MRNRITVSSFALALFFISTLSSFAQELHQDLQGVFRAEVIKIENEQEIFVPGTDVLSFEQDVTARITEGARSGEFITFTNDYIRLEVGDRFYADHLITFEGDEFYSVREMDRSRSMFFLLGLFVVAVVALGGLQGMRSLLSLAGSLLVVVYVLVPQLVSGVSPIPLSILVAGLILFCAIFFTHGFNVRSLVAYIGTVSAVVITGILAFLSIKATSLTGFSSDESVYLNLSTGGELDFVGLLLAGIIIGALGVLDDIAITQVAVVRELFGSGVSEKKEVFTKAMRVGREHVGALVNTLVLAYTGAALPLLLLFSLSQSGPLAILNREVFATEIVRSLVGSIGLIMTVPITTFLAVYVLGKYKDKLGEETHTHHH